MLKAVARLWRNVFWPHSAKAIHFLEEPDPGEVSLACKGVAEERIFCFWMGGVMTPQRAQCLSELMKVSQIPVVLVDRDNVSDWVVAEDPLPKAFHYLSAVHKSDFLRIYFMYHYGGGYSDIKAPLNSWIGAFREVNESPQHFGLGYPEVNRRSVAYIKSDKEFRKRDVYHFNVNMQDEYRTLLGNCCYIFKPKSPLMRIILNEQKRRLELLHDDLMCHPGNAYGDNVGYPVGWSYLLGEIFHPAQMAFRSYLMYSEEVRPNFLNYR